MLAASVELMRHFMAHTDIVQAGRPPKVVIDPIKLRKELASEGLLAEFEQGAL